MKNLIIVLQWIIIILIIIHLIVWFLAYGSGHHISNNTDRAFTRNISILILILIILFFFKHRMK